MRSVKLSAAETWRLSKIEEESDLSSNPSSPFKKLSTHLTISHSGGKSVSPKAISSSHTSQNGNSSEDDGYEKVPNSKEEWEAMKREALAAERAVKAIKSKYDSLERARKQTSCNSPLISRLDNINNNKDLLATNQQKSFELPPEEQIDDDWADIPLPPPHILNNSLPSPPSTSRNTNAMSNTPSPSVMQRSSSVQLIQNKNNVQMKQTSDQQLNQQKQQTNHKHQQNKVQQLNYPQPQQQKQPQQNPPQSQLQQRSLQPKHLLSSHEILQMETFYKGLNTHVNVCECTATLLRRILPATNNRSSDNKPVISSPISIENEWKMMKEGVPMFILDSGDNRRQRRLQLILAERGTGFLLWKDIIDHLSHYQPLSDRLHTLRSSTDHSNLLAIFFPNQTSASSFYRSYQLIIENNHDILQISKKKKKKSPTPTKISIRKNDISQPCCFTHITKVESVDPTK